MDAQGFERLSKLVAAAPNRRHMLGALGAGLLAITGTLGGHLMSAPTDLSKLLRHLGWEVYTTYHVPDFTVWALLGIAALGVALDQAVKAYIRAQLAVGESMPFLPGVLRLTHFENSGAAFSMLSGGWARWACRRPAGAT